MKKLFFSFIAMILVSNLSYGQNKVDLQNAKQIGELHNSYLQSTVKDFTVDEAKYKAVFSSIKPEGVSTDFENEIFNYFKENSIKQQQDIILKELKSSEAKKLFLSTIQTLRSASNYQSSSTELDKKLNDAKNIKGRDQEILYTLIEVSRASLKFWLPVKDGGQGKGEIIIGNAERQGDEDGIDWGSIAVADGVGATGVLIRTWYLAASPLSWGAILGAIGWGAAWGSGTAIIRQLL